jgi:hypothetical protein
MKTLAIALAVAAGAGAPVAAASEVRIQLRATIAPVCAVESIHMMGEGDLSRMAITTNCNTEHFRIMLADGADPLQVSSAVSGQAMVSPVSAGQLAVRLNRPGTQQIEVQLAQALTPGRGVNVQIVPV